MSTHDFTKELNASQLEAVTYCDGPMLVVAGAGSGKTRVLTYKIAYLLQNGYAPWNILSLTFTNKAAREMNERIARLTDGMDTRQMWSGTFHSIFSRLLRREAGHIGYTADFTIYDQSDSRNLVKTIVKELGLDEKVYKASVVASRISEAKNRLILPEAYAADSSIFKRDSLNRMPEIRKVYINYAQRCRRADAMDFDDLLLNTYLLFLHHPEICRHYADRFRYILVDEYQDTNYAQHRILSQLAAAPDSRICVVGDDAQSIYGFRGADISNILQFTTQYPAARTVKLECNYRSTQTIVDAAGSLIKYNAGQIPKKIYSAGAKGELIKVIDSYTDKDESLKIAGEIRHLRRHHDVGFNEIALLYRTNAQSRSFEETFRNSAIPYRIYGGLSFYQRKEIKDVIAYFRLVCNHNDEEAFKRIINYPARGIGQTTLGKLQLAAREHNVSLWKVLGSPATYGLDIKKGALAKLYNFKTLIETLAACLNETDAYSLATTIIRESGLGAELAAGHEPDDITRRENVEELLASIKGFEEETLEETGSPALLSNYLSHVALLTDADNRDDGQPKVTLMTVHAAKGLEFDAVFVTGLEEDLFPNQSARSNQREMEEERRLLYVAITRAKRFCTLSYAKSRFKFGTTEFCNPSPFLREIDKCYLTTDKDTPTITERPQPVFRQFTPSRLRPIEHKPTSPSPTSNPTSTLSIGNTIEHERFGVGVVLAVEGAGDSQKARVDFQNAGTKNLLLKFAKFKVIG